MQQELRLSDERQIFSVSQIVNQIKFQLESRLHDIWVQGEISNLKTPSSGHLYFSLRDNDAQIATVCFRLQAQYLRFQPEDGMTVMARGYVSVYAPRGQFQMVVEHMEPVGPGALQVAFEQLKQRLQKEGLFESAHKKRLPLLPSRIGIVTSPSGAAVHDILRVLKRRNDRVDVLIFPVKVQGQGAGAEIARAIRYLSTRRDLDVLIVGRGGGSFEDLWAFNEEAVARAIFESEIPIISAVGHEIDFTIADFVADLRAPTPSAAAEIVCEKREELCDRVDLLVRRLSQGIRILLQEKRRKLERLSSSRGFVDAESKLRYFQQRLDELHARLLKLLPGVVRPPRERLSRLESDLTRSVRSRLQFWEHRLSTFAKQLEAFSPHAVLSRGYAIVSRDDGAIVRRPDQVFGGEVLGVRVAEGQFRVRKEDDDGI